MLRHEILERSRREEILLAQAQFLSSGRRVAWIEDFRDRLGPDALGLRTKMITLVEESKAQWFAGSRRPQAQRVHMTPAPAHNRRVMSDRQHDFGGVPHISKRPILPMDHLDSPAKPDLECDFAALKLPRIAGFKPVLWVFVLPAVFHGLAEQSVVIANAISERG